MNGVSSAIKIPRSALTYLVSIALFLAFIGCSEQQPEESPTRAVVLSETVEKVITEKADSLEERSDSMSTGAPNPEKDFRLDEGEEFASLNSDIILATGVEDLVPLDTIAEFRTGQQIYAYAAVRAPQDETIHFKWFGPDDKEVLPASYLDIEVNTGPVGYRVYTYRVFRAPGDYRIDMINSAGSKIGEATFEVIR